MKAKKIGIFEKNRIKNKMKNFTATGVEVNETFGEAITMDYIGEKVFTFLLLKPFYMGGSFCKFLNECKADLDKAKKEKEENNTNFLYLTQFLVNLSSQAFHNVYGAQLITEEAYLNIFVDAIRWYEKYDIPFDYKKAMEQYIISAGGLNAAINKIVLKRVSSSKIELDTDALQYIREARVTKDNFQYFTEQINKLITDRSQNKTLEDIINKYEKNALGKFEGKNDPDEKDLFALEEFLCDCIKMNTFEKNSFLKIRKHYLNQGANVQSGKGLTDIQVRDLFSEYDAIFGS